MAMLNERSKCKICGKLLGDAPKVGFIHFVGNRKDPLYMFTDSGFHRDCFLAHPLREAVEKRLEERIRRRAVHRCVVCNEEINGPWYSPDFLTDDPTSPLYEFNYIYLHRSHILLWPRLAEFQRLIEDFVDSGKYEGPPILPKLP